MDTPIPYSNLDYSAKCKVAEAAKPGDIWVNDKTGRKTTVVANTWRGLDLKHESGRKTTKQHHYFASEYHPAPKEIMASPEKSIPEGFVLIPVDELGNPRFEWLNTPAAQQAAGWVTAKLILTKDTEVSPVKPVKSLRESVDNVWGEDSEFSKAEWQYEVGNNDTHQGYWEWVESQREQAEHSGPDNEEDEEDED